MQAMWSNDQVEDYFSKEYSKDKLLDLLMQVMNLHLGMHIDNICDPA